MKKSLLYLALLLSPSVNAENFTGKIVGVADGDTVTLLDNSNTQYKIRLSGIDAPEKKQAFGQRSKQNLSDLVFSKTVDADCTKKDRYQRWICKIIVNGIDVNLQQIKDGMAWHYKAYQKEQSEIDRDVYSDAEEVARVVNKGLWSDTEPQAPWNFRRLKTAM